ncbi:MAG: YcaO-like family protein [Pseudobdellovibrionaceae bacterium]|nr:YcaO-like family protein [Pseudobdellovibrionaceae bacterium]
MVGFGYGATHEQAALVAIAEIIERCVLIANGSLTSNGFAVHTDQLLSQRAAAFELLERDAYLCHHLTREPFLPLVLSQKLREEAPSLAELLSLEESRGLQIKLGKMKALGIGNAVVLAVDGSRAMPPFGVITASAYDVNLSRACERAAREAMSELAYRICNSAWLTLTLEEFKNLDSVKPQHHGQYAIARNKEGWLKEMFATERDQPVRGDDPVIRLTRLEIPEELGSVQIHAYRATSPDVQTLFFGLPSPSVLNFRRLESFCRRKIGFEELETVIPHFLD